MRKSLLLVALLTLANLVFAQKQDNRYFEMRIYYCEPGRLPNLLTRFRDHTTKIFERHGMTNIGYWVPTQNEKNALYYVLAYPDKEARDASWKAFGADPEWKKVSEESQRDGKIVAKVESIFMTATDFSPKIKEKVKNPERMFELRIYTATPNNIDNVLARFRNHTTKLFKKHGMENIAYWKSIEKEGTQSRLVYILAHKSEEAGKASFDSFRKDEKWIKVRDESEKNGKIVEKVESIYMTPTDFSTIR
ncbi:NIPSNAP family containing protein [Emticicia oligotrophica DSM 17448]|uniref:NIPSNAP family containing protein n=1 Tax=Emticicia oligotrophica (strain DSM 17448 / CIP 109782 / MTCC 6937 / GPTSA100-15) TaxID=929562 RepID=A0ABM5MY61_EMTOG|nr:NIPSNAP family protein [Emticicia oligotrophica]AFK02097.1 NIPSNAP family containing protein [Emticicia oligotrophica DSM 17448]